MPGVRYESTTTIDRPIEDVFARLADLAGYRAWMHRTGLFGRCGQTSDGPLGKGTSYFDASRTLRVFGAELMEARPQYSLEADDGRTIVHHVAEGELHGWMRFMTPVAARMATSERSRTVESLKRSLESD